VRLRRCFLPFGNETPDDGLNLLDRDRKAIAPQVRNHRELVVLVEYHGELVVTECVGGAIFTTLSPPPKQRRKMDHYF
jgi:hypothetical protein